MTHADPSSFSGPLPIQPPVRGARIWDGRFIWITIGAVALVFLAALQSLAVTTVMPVVANDLDGHDLYALAFSGTFATSVIGMVAAGASSDRRGPAAPVAVAVGVFVVGLVACALAPSMATLVAGRLIMGLGSGGVVVALYVIVARVYPANLHGRMMAAFSAAWIVPSLMGPAAAGVVAEFLHWRWVFGAVAIFAVLAFALLAPRLSGIPHAEAPSSEGMSRRLLLAVVVAAGALALGLAGRGTWPVWPTAAVAAAAIVVVVLAMRPLVPRRTFLAGRGLPSVILMRGMIAGALFGAEIYVPYLFQDSYGFSPTVAGLALTAAAITWAVGAEITGRHGDRIGNRNIALAGVSLLAAALVVMAAAAAWMLPVWIPIACWGLAGIGMGFMYPRLTVLTLAYSSRANQGFNSSALQISDAVGTAATMAVAGLVFALSGFLAVFLMTLVIALLAALPGLRLGHVAELR